MKDLGKGIGIGLCGIAIAAATIWTQAPVCMWAFVPLIFIAAAMYEK